jgi:uncharacterized Tic20 family protein
VSEEGGFGISTVEKGFGLILLIIGILASYYTFTSAQVLGTFTTFFGVLTIAICVLGLVMITAKTE